MKAKRIGVKFAQKDHRDCRNFLSRRLDYSNQKLKVRMKSLSILVVLVCLPFSLTGITNAQKSMNTIPPLDSKQQSIIPISAFTAKGNQEKLSQSLNDGLNAGLSINEIKEILVQLYAYAGFPRSLNAISTLENVVNDRKKEGIKDDEGKTPDKVTFKNSRFEFGKDVQTKLTGSTSTGSAQKFVPVIDTFLKEHLFADIFSRNNLDYQSREIVTISALASLGGTEAQLLSHLKVGKNIGLTEEQLRSLAFILSTKVGRQEGSLATKNIDLIFNSQKKNTSQTITEINNEQTAHRIDRNDKVFPKGDKITNDNFSGTAWLNMLVENDSIYNTPIGNVTFEPGARTKWHYHPGGQILLVTRGKGFYQEKGKPIQIIQEGDVIKCPPNVIHWHGATPTDSLTHIAISPNTDKGNVVWLEKVTDEEYNSVRK
jgi:quercetin dioxygenase-like cupin family protein/alkylhydroperoxidase/carboxymuconolactone decarboxylase family protein YurZ